MSDTKNYTLADFHMTSGELQAVFQNIIQNQSNHKDLQNIFSIGLDNLSLFPVLSLKEGASAADYLARWASGYLLSKALLPSLKTASPKKTCSDPVTALMVSAKVGEISGEESEKYHDLYMSAENVQGDLLEEYIAKSIAPYGWIWCCGEVLRAVDFCSADGKVLLQVKNKSNSENSSSKSVRNGTDIRKWCRLGTRHRGGLCIPFYHWDELNSLIDSSGQGAAEPCSMSEGKYCEFIADVLAKNPAIIC